MPPVQLIILDPGHFHAALVQKEMLDGVLPRVHVYAPLGPDLTAHLNRIAGFNARRENPTSWELEVHAASDFLERMLRERAGTVVVLSGRNRQKIEYIQAAIEAGLNVLADKPWIISADHLPILETVLNAADEKGVIAYDIMTERHEITSILQREWVNDPEVFGAPVAGTEEEPGVFMESVHYLMKLVAGVPIRRPAWFFDIREQGEGLTDVGTHLVDLVPWILFPEQPVDHRREIRILAAKRWPTVLSMANFQKVTAENDFPDHLSSYVQDGRLDYYCNTLVSYTLRGIHVKLNILWDVEAAAGAGDTHLAVFRGSRSRIEIRQGAATPPLSPPRCGEGPGERLSPELYVVPNQAGDKRGVLAAVKNKVHALQPVFPGIGVREKSDRLWITIPDNYRVGHEAHFAQVTRQFLAYLNDPRSLPGWEKPNMLAKYYVTAEGIRRSHLVA